MSILKPKFQDRIIVNSQTTDDLLNGVIRAIKDSEEQARHIAPLFRRKDDITTCYLIFEFLKKNVPYKRESPNGQTVRTIARILHDKNGDCKHYAIFAASILRALKIPFKLRLISQDFYNSEPTHIYVVCNNDIILDPVLKQFNNEAAYKYKYDYKLK